MSAVLVLVWGVGHEGYALVPELDDVFAGESSPRGARPCSPLHAVRSLVAAALEVLWAEGHIGYALSTELGDVLVEGAESPGPGSPGEWVYTQL